MVRPSFSLFTQPRENFMPANRKAEVEAAQKDLDFTKNSYQVVLDTSAGQITLNMLP
jgi:hypothetical protein